MTDQYQIADKTYMYGKKYEPDKIDILEEIKYDFSAVTLYDLESFLILPIWKIISDYAEPYKKLIIEIWKYKDGNLRHCNWFGEYTFGVHDFYGSNYKLWLTNKAGQTFQSLYDNQTGPLKSDYIQLIESQLELPYTDYDSKKQPFGYRLSHIEIRKCISNDDNKKLLKNTFSDRFPKKYDIFVDLELAIDDFPEFAYMNIAFIMEIDHIYNEAEWILDLCKDYGIYGFQKS